MTHNPFAEFEISQGWHDTHQAIDYKTPVGFVYGAPAAGTYRRMPPELGRFPGQAGMWGRLHLDDGRSISFAHNEGHLAADGARVAEGDPLAVTGNTGYVLPSPSRADPDAGAHMHTYGLDQNGNRWDWTTEYTQEDDVSAEEVWTHPTAKATATTGEELPAEPMGIRQRRMALRLEQLVRLVKSQTVAIEALAEAKGIDPAPIVAAVEKAAGEWTLTLDTGS